MGDGMGENLYDMLYGGTWYHLSRPCRIKSIMGIAAEVEYADGTGATVLMNQIVDNPYPYVHH
jgi:hypothetical protein